jgi:hypothetical protein
VGRVMERAMTPLPLIDRTPIKDALEPVDRVAGEMEGKWGVGRLPRLVSPEMAAKFSSARAKLDEAIRANDLEAVVSKAAVVIRGWHALDKAATEAGHKTYPQGVWSTKHRGTTYTVVLDRADVNKVAHDSKDAGHVVTLAELLLVWDEFQGNRVISQTKSLFPGATVEKVGGIAELDDDIPWN